MSNQAEKKEYFGVLAEFDTPDTLYNACKKVNKEGFKRWDAYTPYPVHGLEKAMGAPPSNVPWIVLIMGLTGCTTGIVLQYWASTQGYAFVISAKPLFSWPAFVPVTFELTILFSALGAVLGMLALNRLPQHYHPLFQSKRFEQVTDNKFFIAIEAKDPKFDPEKTAEFLKEIGANHTELVEP